MVVFAVWVTMALIFLAANLYSAWVPGNERRNRAIKEGRDEYIGANGFKKTK